MKKANRVFTLFLAFAILITGMPFGTLTAHASTNGHTQAQAVEWIKARGNEGWWQDVDGAYGCQCVDLAYAYYKYLVGYRVGGNGCDFWTNSLPDDWYRDYTPTPGCIISWKENSYAGDNWYTGDYGHVGLVYAVSGSTVYTVETNVSTNGHSGEYGYSYAKFRERHPQNVIYIHPDFVTDTAPPSNVQLALEKTNFFTDEHVTYYCTGNNVSYYYISIYDENGNVIEAPRVNPGEYVTRYYNPGRYTAYCEAYNSLGHTFSNTLSFSVVSRYGSEMTSGCARVLDDGIYIIANAASPDLEKSIYYLDIEGVESPAKDGTNVSLCGPHNIKEFSFCDMWQITYSNGFYSIKQAGTNVSLDVGNASQETSANVISCGYHGGSNQQWAISKNGSGGYRVQAKCSGMSLDVAGGGTVNGTNIQQWVNNDSAAQSWIFIKHEHSFGSWQTVQAATCTANGTRKRVCQYCGYTEVGTIHIIGHTFSDWETVTASTCVTDGSERRVCSVCGETEERIIPAHHTEQLIRTVSQTCTNGGYDLVRCIVCGTRYQTNPTAALGHHHLLTETVAPTCTEKGYDVYCCDRCGDTYQTNETAALGHHHLLTESVAPTCAEVGYEVYCCDRCGDTYQTNETAALGHDYQFTGTVAATCVKAGYHRYTCTRCGGEERTAIPAIGHYFLDGFCVDCGVDERIAPFDINGDATLDAVDLILTRMALLKKEEETPCDFNNDGVSDIRDMVRMKKMLATVLS